MSRSRSIRRPITRTSARKKTLGQKIFALLPESLQAFFARRLVDIYAVTLAGAGFFVILSLATYHQADPSWNASGGAGGNIYNWGGTTGAFLSDLLLQTLGIGSYVLGIILAAWGVKTYLRQNIGPFFLRVPALVLTCLGASVALAQIPTGDWAVHPYIGSVLAEMLLARLNEFSPHLAQIGVPVIAGACSFLVFLFAAAFTKSEIFTALSAIKSASVSAFQFCAQVTSDFTDWIAHYNEPNYVRPTRAQAAKKPTAEKIRKTPVIGLSDEGKKFVAKKSEPSIPIVAAATAKPQAKSQPEQQRFALSSSEDGAEWNLPPLTLLQEVPEENLAEVVSEETLRQNAELLQNVLADFNVQGEIVSIHPGPVVTLYELEPAPGTKTSRVISLADDIARSMSAVSVRCAVVPGRNVIGIELPNRVRQTVYMREMLNSQLFEKTKAKLPLILGKDISGQPILADLAKMPHLLVAGTTGSGKSVAVNTMIMSLLYRLPPEKCRFIMIDPKMLELSIYDDIPHLLSPVVTEPGQAIVALKWTVNEMEERYRAMSKLGVRNIDGYNARLREAAKNGEVLTRKVQTGFDADTGKPIYEEQAIDLTELPYIVVIVDEFADLMLVAGKDVENAIQRLAQMARAAGIHLIMATQRPSVDVITGVIKANFPTRISFAVTSKIDSRTILGEGGAEQLLGMGDMLYMAPGGRITRVHGPFASDKDVENVTNFLREQSEPQYIDDIAQGDGDFGGSAVMRAMFGGEGGEGGEGVDELYDQAVAIVAREGKASTSFIQRYLQIGYNRAARIIEEMERQGIISQASPTGKREILVRDFSDV